MPPQNPEISSSDAEDTGSDLEKKKSRAHDPLKRTSFVCPEPNCGKVFAKKFLLKTHNGVHSKQKPWSCTECRKSFAQKSRLKRHQKTHSGYVCSRKGCQHRFAKWSQLRKHVAEVHPLSHDCSECGKSFKLSTALSRHQRIHLVEAECPVDGCNMRLAQRNLAQHLERNHKDSIPTTSSLKSIEVRRHTCKLCTKAFLRLSHLQRHVSQVHENSPKETREKKFSCAEPGCGRKFAIRSKWESHVNWHTGERPYLCGEEGCGRKFCGREALVKHVRKGHGKVFTGDSWLVVWAEFKWKWWLHQDTCVWVKACSIIKTVSSNCDWHIYG